jgi:hypothetical protein
LSAGEAICSLTMLCPTPQRACEGCWELAAAPSGPR